MGVTHGNCFSSQRVKKILFLKRIGHFSISPGHFFMVGSRSLKPFVTVQASRTFLTFLYQHFLVSNFLGATFPPGFRFPFFNRCLEMVCCRGSFL